MYASAVVSSLTRCVSVTDLYQHVLERERESFTSPSRDGVPCCSERPNIMRQGALSRTSLASSCRLRSSCTCLETPTVDEAETSIHHSVCCVHRWSDANDVALVLLRFGLLPFQAHAFVTLHIEHRHSCRPISLVGCVDVVQFSLSCMQNGQEREREIHWSIQPACECVSRTLIRLVLQPIVPLEISKLKTVFGLALALESSMG